MKALHVLFAVKAVALMGGGGFMYAYYQNKSQAHAEDSAPAEAKKQDNAAAMPEIPEKGLSLSKAAELRNQLLLMRKDVEQKTEKLNVARQGYERSKADIEAKLKRIEEERKLLEETLQKERKAKEERLSESLEFIAKMEPKKAASVIEGMDRDLVMQLLRKLPPRQVTRLLEAVNPKKATEFLEYYTRIRSAREYELFRELGFCQGTGSEEGTNEKPANDKGAAGRSGGTGASPAPAPNGAVNSGGAAPAPSGGSTESANSPAANATPAASASGPATEPTAVR